MKKYENEDMIENVDKIAKEILDSRKRGYVRDYFFPEIINKMDLKVGVEIGVDKAGFSKHILDLSSLERLHCVDTWQDDFGSDHRPDYFDAQGDNRYREAESVLKPYEGRYYMWRMTSLEAAQNFADESIDFCYIDGDHSLEGIYTDIKAWLPKVKVGGIISGHDYKDGPKSGISDYFGGQLHFNIKTVVDDYCARYGHAEREVGGLIMSWYFVKNKVTEDHVKSYLLQKPESLNINIPLNQERENLTEA
jgi:hypothetical protein